MMTVNVEEEGKGGRWSIFIGFSSLENRIGRSEVIDPIFGQLFVHSCSLSVRRRALRLEHLMVERLKGEKLT